MRRIGQVQGGSSYHGSPLANRAQDTFFVVELRADINKVEIKDQDPLITSELMDGRDSFLLFVTVSICSSQFIVTQLRA